jgi:nitronate monooxygenase
MTTPEAATSRAHRAAIHGAAAARTVVTRAFSGRHARAIANRYTDAFAGLDVPPFPGFQRDTRDVRSAAAQAGRADLMQMFAGQGAPLARDLPAGELVAALAGEMEASLGA